MFAVANELCANLKGGSWNRYTHERIAVQFSLETSGQQYADASFMWRQQQLSDSKKDQCSANSVENFRLNGGVSLRAKKKRKKRCISRYGISDFVAKLLGACRCAGI